MTLIHDLGPRAPVLPDETSTRALAPATRGRRRGASLASAGPTCGPAGEKDRSRRWPARGAILVGGLLSAAVASPQPPPLPAAELLSGPVLDRRGLVAAVLARNPGIAAAAQAWEAATQRIPQARSLEDPMASYSVAPLSVRSRDVSYGEVLELGQRFPFPGSLRLRGEMATHEAAAAGQRLEAVRLRLATLASQLFDSYFLVARELEINAEHRRLLAELQQVAISRYSAGLAPQQAPIQAEVEAAHLEHRELVLETSRRTIVARLNALLHREPRTPLPPPPRELALPSLPEGIDPGSTADALPPRPELEAQRAAIEALRAAVELEELDFYPDFEAMTSYNSMWGMREHRWMVGVGVNVPLRRQRVRAGVAEAEARLASAESELVRLEDAVLSEVEVAAQELRESLHVVALYRDRLLPAARDQLAAARVGFETGASSMLSLIDAERSLRTAELGQYQARAQASTRRAELDRVLGRLPSSAADAGAERHLENLQTETER